MTTQQLKSLSERIARALEPLRNYVPRMRKILRHDKHVGCDPKSAYKAVEWVPDDPRIPFNKLPLVSVATYKWLARHHPKFCQWTRYDSRPDDWIKRSDLPGIPSPSRPPRIIQHWVGSHSLEAITSRYERAIYEEAQLELEYYDPEETPPETVDSYSGFSTRRIREAEEISEESLVAMLSYNGEIEDPDTGELRPIRYGDVIELIVKDTCRDPSILDQLYVDEPYDPRCEADSIIRSLTRDQVSRAYGLERSYHEEGTRMVPTGNGEFMPITTALHEGDARVAKLERALRLPKTPPSPLPKKSVLRDPRRNLRHTPSI